MGLTVMVGDDEQQILETKVKLLEGDYQVIDCSEEPGALLDLLRSPGLFTRTRQAWVMNFDALDDAQVAEVAKTLKSSEATAVCRAATLSAKAKTLLKGKAEILTMTSPKGKMVGVRVSEMIHASGLKMDPIAKKMLLERLGHDPDRLGSVLKQCKMAGIKSPTVSQLNVLVGTSAAPGVPWDVGDSIERGQGRLALEANDGLTPIAVIAYLANRVAVMGRYAEAENPEAQQEALKSVHKFQAQKMARLGDRLGPEGTRKAIALLGEFDVRVKVSKTPEAELDLLLVELAKLFTGLNNRSL